MYRFYQRHPSEWRALLERAAAIGPFFDLPAFLRCGSVF
jgi:hypothetical protein